ncbi:serine aminopeptidase domain-containing protein [Aquimarina sp. Aq107]|uniref:serine aminopeptidase domain-containing protein n=1 Tax=Aquimarina sp. Aq107 TaxID=1191912 RepID=UPI000D55D3C6|nr:alpha/beta hydrolase [Aquimarina sp. Aq107]
MIEEIEIKTKSGTLSASIFGATNPNDTVLIIASATGVKQEFYKKFAQFIAINGITVITFDYYGIGRSLKKPIKELKNNAADWGRIDLESVLKYTLKNFSASKKVLLGHSIGGQLIGLSETSTTMLL